MVHAGRGIQAEFGGSPERGVAGFFRGWEGFLGGALLLDLKEDRERKSGGEGHADLCLQGLWTEYSDSS